MATTRRFFVENIGRETLLTDEAYRHAKSVLRLRAGDEVVLFDGSGKEYTAVVNAEQRGALLCTVTGSTVSEKECKTPVALFCGALKGDKTELVVQKATELGVCEVGVFESRYCSAYMNENKLARLQKVAREAAQQCLRATVPAVRFYRSLAEVFEAAAGYENKLFACEFAQKSDKDLRALQGPCALIVGSEGGFAPEEFAAAGQAGFAGVTLGKRILRAETACIAFTAAVMFCLGEWA